MRIGLIITLVIWLFGPSEKVSCQENVMNIAVALPESKTKNFNGVAIQILHELEKAVIESDGICRLVERSNFTELRAWHNSLSKASGGMIPSDIMNGAEYLLKTTFLKLSKKRKSVGKIVETRIKSEIEFELIQIETGAVVGQYKATPYGYHWASDETKDFYNSYDDFRDCLRTVVKYMLMQFQVAKIDVLKVKMDKKNSPQKIYISGGTSSEYLDKLKLNVCYKDFTEFNGKRIERSIVVGRCQVEKSLNKYSICQIKSGQKEIQAALNEGKLLYCRPVDLEPITSCEGKLESKERRNRLSTFVKDALGN